MKRILSSALLAAFALAVVGCNTVKGVGQDVQKAGEKIEGAAKKIADARPHFGLGRLHG